MNRIETRQQFTPVRSGFPLKKTNKCFLPVVKRSWLSAKGLDRDNEGKAAGGWDEGGTVVEAGEDWVRTRGWWAKTSAGTLVGSSWTPDLRINCLCGSHHKERWKRSLKDCVVEY